MDETNPSTPGTTRRKRKTKEERKREVDIFMMGQMEHNKLEAAVKGMVQKGAKILEVRARVPVGKSIRKVWHRVAVMPDGALFFVDHGFSSPRVLLAEYELLNDRAAHMSDCCYSVVRELLNYRDPGFSSSNIHQEPRNRRGRVAARAHWHADLWSNGAVSFFGAVYKKRLERRERQKDPQPVDAWYKGVPFSHSAEIRIRPIYQDRREEEEKKLQRVTKVLKKKGHGQHGTYNGGIRGEHFDYFSSLVGKARRG